MKYESILFNCINSKFSVLLFLETEADVAEISLVENLFEKLNLQPNTSTDEGQSIVHA